MFNFLNNKIYWHGQEILASPTGLVTSGCGFDLACDNMREYENSVVSGIPMVSRSSGPITITLPSSWNAGNDTKIKSLEQRLEKRTTQINYNFRILEKRIQELQDNLKILKESKIDRPSLSQDLINAERYIDDIRALQKKYNRERFVRQQKIRQKLKRIKEANKKNIKIQPVRHNLLFSFLVGFLVPTLVGTLIGIGVFYVF